MFYDKFLYLCNLKDVSPSAAALEMGFQKSVVTRWKNGTMPRDANLQKIAEYFNVTVDDLVAENAQENKKEDDVVTYDDFTYAMYNHSKELTDEEKKMLLEMAEFMKQKRGL